MWKVLCIFRFCRFPLTGGEQYGIIIKILTVCRYRNGACAHAQQSSDGDISLAEETMLQVDFQRGEEFFFMAFTVCVFILAVEYT